MIRTVYYNPNSQQLIHWPWGDNRCSFDSTMTFFWVVYVMLRKQSTETDQAYQQLAQIVSQYPQVTDIFNLVFIGEINNVEARNRLFYLFNVDDDRWKRSLYVQTSLTYMYLKSKLWVEPNNINDSVFRWRFETVWHCINCKKFKNKEPKIQWQDAINLLGINCKPTVSESIKISLRESVKNKICFSCSCQLKINRRTIAHPIILHLVYPTNEQTGYINLPIFVDKCVDFDGQNYDIVGATYGNGNHFKFRFLFNDKVHEADSMNSRDSDGTPMALSIPTNQDYDTTLPGELPKLLRTGRSYKICDVYYKKRCEVEQDYKTVTMVGDFVGEDL